MMVQVLCVVLLLDVFSWLLINCDLFTLNIDEHGNAVPSSSIRREKTNETLLHDVQQQVFDFDIYSVTL